MTQIVPTDISAGIHHFGQVIPDEVAVTYESQRLTFAELNRALSSFASKLDQTVNREALLPILAGVNLDSYIAIASAMRAGIPFASIDSSNPPEAIDEILAELGHPQHIVIASVGANPYVPKECVAVAMEYGDEVDFPPRAVNKDDLACVMFTSGSTGKPKGVMFDWSRLDSIRTDHIRILNESRNIHRFAVHNSLGFLFGFWRSLTVSCGYAIAIRDPFKYSADELIAKINEDGTTHMGLVPSLLEKISDFRSPDSKFTTLVEVILSGESSSWEQVAKIQEMSNPEVQINAVYGASEIQYIPLDYILPREIGEGKVPFNRIVHPDRFTLQPISEGSSINEVILYEPIALGYWNDPELTEQKFGIDENGRRYLRTGDLLRSMDNGFYMHAGRADDLVKINGRLVEPSESERVLKTIPGIESVVVLPHLNKEEKHFLVGHVKIEEGSNLTPNKIYEILLSKLASNLVPSMLVKHKEIPLTDRGKVDRQFLINSQWERWSVSSERSALTPTETFAQRTIAEILGHSDLALDEDLFGAGMDSFAALEFITIATEYGFESFTPNAFLNNRTVRSIAAMLDSKREENFDTALLLNAIGSEPPIFCFPGGGVTALWFREFASEVGTNQPLAIIEARGLHSNDLPDKSIEEYASRALSEIQRLQPEGEVHILGHSAGGTVAFAVAQLLREMNRDVKLISLDSHSVLERLRVPITAYKFGYEVRRIKKLFARPMKENVRAITRRFNSLVFTLSRGRITSPQAKYDRFLLLAGESMKNYMPKEPDFPIYLMYVRGSENFELWKSLPTLKTRLVSGNHMNLLEQPHVKEVAQETLAWLNAKLPQESQ
jgi:acyl-CoA synthetase (AMP-forming)/AMP-acid ligase II/thioesterase domain-containing protein